MHVLVVYKRSRYDYFKPHFKGISKQKKTDPKLADYHDRIYLGHQRHAKTLNHVKKTLAAHGVKATVTIRSSIRKPIVGYDLIVTVGGDGTVLSAARHIKDIPVLAVNSDPHNSFGFFTSCDAAGFEGLLLKFMKNRRMIQWLPRLTVVLNGKKLDEHVLNDVLICHHNPSISCIYELTVGARSEVQRSSGIWISTGAGSTGGTLSAGGKILSPLKPVKQFVVREPLLQHRYWFKKGVVSIDQTLKVRSLTHDARIYLDGSRIIYHFNMGDAVEIVPSAYPLPMVGFTPIKQEYLRAHMK